MLFFDFPMICDSLRRGVTHVHLQEVIVFHFVHKYSWTSAQHVREQNFVLFLVLAHSSVMTFTHHIFKLKAKIGSICFGLIQVLCYLGLMFLPSVKVVVWFGFTHSINEILRLLVIYISVG